MSEVPLDLVQFWGLVEGRGYQLCEQARHPVGPGTLSNNLEHSGTFSPHPSTRHPEHLEHSRTFRCGRTANSSPNQSREVKRGCAGASRVPALRADAAPRQPANTLEYSRRFSNVPEHSQTFSNTRTFSNTLRPCTPNPKPCTVYPYHTNALPLLV